MNILFSKLWSLLFFSIFLFASINGVDNPIDVTIFIHGVSNIESHLGISTIIPFIKDQIEHSYYEHNINHFRNAPYFYQFQAMQQRGLHKITDTCVKPGNTCAALVHVFNSTFNRIDQSYRKNNHYYTYGWSGMHSVKEYRKAGNALRQDIQKLKQGYRIRGYKPRIRVIGYSHGGNVALMIADQSKPMHHMLVDELILLGTPFISGATVEHIANPCFKKVYNIYSLSDKVQRHDIITPQAFWCEQKLTKKSLNPLPTNLIQVRLRYTVPSYHAQHNAQSFKHSSNYSKQSIINGRSTLLRNTSPGHLEMWLFGWALSNYRSHFVAYPIPAGALSIPYILYYLAHVDTKKEYNPNQEFIIDVRPFHEVVLINRKTKKNGTICIQKVPFFKKYQFSILQEQILQYRPLNLTRKSYREILQNTNNEAWYLFNTRKAWPCTYY